MFLVPQHWSPKSFLSFYIDDLTLFIEYYISRLSVIESLSLMLNEIRLPTELYPRLPAAQSAVSEIIRYRKLFLSVEEALDIDLYVNHYFHPGDIVPAVHSARHCQQDAIRTG